MAALGVSLANGKPERGSTFGSVPAIWGPQDSYHLVICYIAMENQHFSLENHHVQ